MTRYGIKIAPGASKNYIREKSSKFIADCVQKESETPKRKVFLTGFSINKTDFSPLESQSRVTVKCALYDWRQSEIGEDVCGVDFDEIGQVVRTWETEHVTKDGKIFEDMGYSMGWCSVYCRVE